jgi:UDP:flavonoid glycosyltransferase YjiC (YdhE family)
MNCPILQLLELHRSRVFPDADHPSKALSNVFTEKRQDGIFAGLHMPAGRFVLAITSGREHRRFPGQWPGIGSQDGRQMRILFSATPAAGHVLPLVPLANAAGDAGHDVAFLTGPDMAGYLGSRTLVPAGPILADLQESAIARADDQATARGLRPRRRFALVDPLPDVLRSPADPPLPDDRVVLRPTAHAGDRVSGPVPGLPDGRPLVLVTLGTSVRVRGLPARLAMVLRPVLADQPWTAQRVARAGAGLVIDDPAEAGPAVRTVLTDPRYRTAAQEAAAAIQSMPAPEAALGDLLARAGLSDRA